MDTNDDAVAEEHSMREIEKEIGELRAEIAAMRAEMQAKLDAVTKRIDEVVITQINVNTGKIAELDARLSALERRQVWIAGWIAGAGVIGAAVAWLVGKVL